MKLLFKNRRRDKIVLVAESSMAHRRMIGSWLESYGVRVLMASDGRQAWKLVQRESVDLLVSSIDMPQMNGLDLVRAIRTSDYRLLPIVLLTTAAWDREGSNDTTLSINAVLQKSTLDMTHLLDTVSHLLQSGSNRPLLP